MGVARHYRLRSTGLIDWLSFNDSFKFNTGIFQSHSRSQSEYNIIIKLKYWIWIVSLYCDCESECEVCWVIDVYSLGYCHACAFTQSTLLPSRTVTHCQCHVADVLTHSLSHQVSTANSHSFVGGQFYCTSTSGQESECAINHLQPKKLVKVAVVGLPNSGKSTLVNTLIGKRVSLYIFFTIATMAIQNWN